MRWKKAGTKRRRRSPRWTEAYSYRVPMQVRLYIRHRLRGAYPLCPRCGSSLEREYLLHCSQCGQKLGWDRLNEAGYIRAGDRERKVYGIRRVRLTAARDEHTERLSITVPVPDPRNR